MATKEEILDAIAGMTVLELSELLSDFEEKFGVTAAAPVAVAAAAPGPASADRGPEAVSRPAVPRPRAGAPAGGAGSWSSSGTGNFGSGTILRALASSRSGTGGRGPSSKSHSWQAPQ